MTEDSMIARMRSGNGVCSWMGLIRISPAPSVRMMPSAAASNGLQRLSAARMLEKRKKTWQDALEMLMAPAIAILQSPQRMDWMARWTAVKDEEVSDCTIIEGPRRSKV